MADTHPAKAVKPGWKTTEFWVAVLTSVGAIAADASDALPSKYAALLIGVSTLAYSVSRGLAKH